VALAREAPHVADPADNLRGQDRSEAVDLGERGEVSPTASAIRPSSSPIWRSSLRRSRSRSEAKRRLARRAPGGP
jgi:hypothetical protein